MPPRKKKEVAPKQEQKSVDPADAINPEDFPDDIKQALNVLVGNRPDSFVREFGPKGPEQATPSANMAGAGFGGSSAQDEFIKKKDPVERKVKLTKNKVYIFDLTNSEDRDKYEDIVDKVFDPANGINLAEPLKDPNIMVDENAPFGYRAIVVIRTTKPVEYLVPKGTGYRVVKNPQNEQTNQ